MHNIGWRAMLAQCSTIAAREATVGSDDPAAPTGRTGPLKNFSRTPRSLAATPDEWTQASLVWRLAAGVCGRLAGARRTSGEAPGSRADRLAHAPPTCSTASPSGPQRLRLAIDRKRTRLNFSHL